MRYMIARFLWRIRFPSGNLTATDFRPHFDGHWLNAIVLIPAGLDPPAVEQALTRRLRQAYGWMRVVRFLLRSGDRIQYCLGTRVPMQQYMKAWSSRDDLSSGVPPRDVAEYWRPSMNR